MKNLFLKIACVVAAILVWIQVAATTVIEADVDLPLAVTGLGDGLTVAGNALPATAEVRLRAPKLAVVAQQYLGIALGEMQVDLTDWPAQPTRSYELSTTDVSIEGEVVAILSPVRFPLRIDVEETRLLPVRVSLRGRLPDERRLAGEVRVVPDSVVVTGPRRFFAGVDTLATEPVELGRLDRTATRDVAVVPPPAPLEAAVSSVTVTIPVMVLGERVLANVPVIALIGRQPDEAGISPPVCDVLVRGPADSVAALSPARLTVTVLVSDLEPGVHEVAGQVQAPGWVLDVEIEPEVFMVLVGEPETGETDR